MFDLIISTDIGIGFPIDADIVIDSHDGIFLHRS